MNLSIRRIGRVGSAGRPALVFVSFIVAICLAACGNGSTQEGRPSQAEPPLDTVASIASPRQVVRPLDAYLPGSEDMMRLETARYRAMNACLAGKGQAGRFLLPQGLALYVSGLVADRTLRSSLYGFFDVANATMYGYHRPPSIPGILIEAPPGGVSQNVSEACFNAGSRAVGGAMNVSEYADFGALPGGGPAVPTGDSRYRAVVQRWSDCMQKFGYSYRDPLNAIGDPRWRSANATADEIAVATADVQCKVSTNLVGVAQAVQSATDQAYVSANETRLSTYRQTWQESIR